MLDINKLISITEDALMAQAKVRKRDGESDAKAFSRVYEADIDFRKRWKIIQDAKHLQALKGYPNVVSMTPVSVGGTDAMDVNSASKAYAQLQGEDSRATEAFTDIVA